MLFYNQNIESFNCMIIDYQLQLPRAIETLRLKSINFLCFNAIEYFIKLPYLCFSFKVNPNFLL